MGLVVSKRVFLTLPDVVAEDLELWAEAEGNKAASLAGFIVESAVRQARDQGKIPQRQSATNTNSTDLPKSLQQLILRNWADLAEKSNIELARLKALRDATSKPFEVEILRIALTLGLSESFVSELPLKNGEKYPNGIT